MSVSPKEKLFFTEHFSLMLKAEIPLAEVLEVLRNEVKSGVFKKALGDVTKRVLEGESLNKGLAQHPRIFDKFFRNVVKIGEESGTLQENLRYLSDSLRSEYSLRRKIIGALIYPALIMVFALFVVVSITVFILPKLLNLFQSLEIQLPLTTRILLGTGSFLQQYWIFILGGVFLSLLIFKMLQRIQRIKFYFHKSTLFFPFFGNIEKNRNLARFSRNFYTLYKSGIPLLEALDICVESTSNEVFKRDIASARAGVERGEKISTGLKSSSKTFPLIFSQMILVGEKTGTLEESMLYLAEFYEAEVDSVLKNLSGILEPILLILVGFFIVFVALSIIVPIYQFTTNLRIG
jgi:type II secretory pathway component PulF